jgi:transcriptional regulator with XRE-family HTH domain
MDTQTIVKEILGTGVTQDELAERANCSQALISAYLNGKRGSRPTYEIGARLMDIHRAVVGGDRRSVSVANLK